MAYKKYKNHIKYFILRKLINTDLVELPLLNIVLGTNTKSL